MTIDTSLRYNIAVYRRSFDKKACFWLLTKETRMGIIGKNASHGGVKVSTGIVKRDKRVEPDNLYKGPHLKLNANNNKLALAA